MFKLMFQTNEAKFSQSQMKVKKTEKDDGK